MEMTFIFFFACTWLNVCIFQISDIEILLVRYKKNIPQKM